MRTDIITTDVECQRGSPPDGADTTDTPNPTDAAELNRVLRSALYIYGAEGSLRRPGEKQLAWRVNFSVGLGNPFRSFRQYGGEGLEAQLNQLRAAADEPIVFVIHYTCPRVDFC